MQLHLRVAQQLLESVQLVSLLIIDVFDAGVHQNFQAVDARGMRNIDRRVFDVRAVFCRLSNGVHLRVNGAKTILLGIAVTTIYLTGLIVRPKHAFLRMGFDSLLVLGTTGAGMLLLYYLK